MRHFGLAIGCTVLLSGCFDTVNEIASPACAGTEQATSRLFLQQLSDSGALVRWRGEADVLCFGTDPDALNTGVKSIEEAGHREARLTGLRPDTVYYYSIGGAPTAPRAQHFRTAPGAGELPSDGNTRVLLLGDSGTAGRELASGKAREETAAVAVKTGISRFLQSRGDEEPIDLLLLLGDNAYSDGSDDQWQKSFFEIYGDFTATVATWPTIGNHEMGKAATNICDFMPLPACASGPVLKPISGASESSDPASYDSTGDGPDAGGMPYLSLFNLPSRGELGGAPSGTEQYYSFDHANLHVVSLDSQLSNRDPVQRATMRQWLVDDLTANTRNWTIVIFHHPPYSKGVHHDSDEEQPEIDMRESFGPLFEAHGVDMVFSGHAHSYERSWYLHGHQGKSKTFDPATHAELNAAGEPAIGQDEETYRQISPASGRDDKVVYTVTGSAGQADPENPCKPGYTLLCTREDWLTHPAHRRFEPGPEDYHSHGIARLGSVLLDVGKDTLTSRFIDTHGEVLDWFTITR